MTTASHLEQRCRQSAHALRGPARAWHVPPAYWIAVDDEDSLRSNVRQQRVPGTAGRIEAKEELVAHP